MGPTIWDARGEDWPGLRQPLGDSSTLYLPHQSNRYLPSSFECVAG